MRHSPFSQQLRVQRQENAEIAIVSPNGRCQSITEIVQNISISEMHS